MTDIVKRVWDKYLGINSPEANMAKELATEVERLRAELDALRLSSLLSIDILRRFVGGQRVEALAPGGRLIIEYCDTETRAESAPLPKSGDK